jgi:hypothetical protein
MNGEFGWQINQNQTIRRGSFVGFCRAKYQKETNNGVVF